MDLKYLGHSAFEFTVKDKSILVDPNIAGNEKYNWHERNITDILLTHAHSDHLGQAIEIAKEKDATVTAVAELARYCSAQGCMTREVNIGGWIHYDWGNAIFLPAFHSSSLPDGSYAGMPASILFDIEKMRIYHAGDTCLNSEMKLVKELYRPSIAMIPIGGTYTMDVEHAALAAQWIGARTVIPIHYNTFPSIDADIKKFIRLVQASNINPLVLNPKEI